MTFTQQSKIFVDRLETRKRNPVSENTIRAYQSYLKTWILPELGTTEVAAFENGAMRAFVRTLRPLAPATVVSIANLVKEIVASAQDANGNELYPRSWNNDFMDLPTVSARDQKTPTIGSQSLQEAISRSQGQFGALYALLAGTGLRISEALALRAAPDDGRSSVWLPEDRKLVIRGQLQNGEFVRPKTAAGYREVDINEDMNGVLCQLQRPAGDLLFAGYNKGPLPLPTAYDAARRDGIPGFHSLRRFRITYLENQGVPRGLVQFWAGHSCKSITERYVKAGRDIAARKEWAEKVGLGFTLDSSASS